MREARNPAKVKVALNFSPKLAPKPIVETASPIFQEDKAVTCHAQQVSEPISIHTHQEDRPSATSHAHLEEETVASHTPQEGIASESHALQEDKAVTDNFCKRKFLASLAHQEGIEDAAVSHAPLDGEPSTIHAHQDGSHDEGHQACVDKIEVRQYGVVQKLR